MNNINPIDIIIPVYNAYEDLTKCIASIYETTDLNVHYLIIINDKSPDERIAPYLNSIEGGHIIVISNEKNKGFSANINIGMGVSDHDVILLNSDTIVTEGWIDKIRNCAYSEQEIGTVTPLSNSATLASIPVFGQDNRIPANMTIDKLAALVERVSLKSYPRIPVAVGFCMYIKREVIQNIGNFDAETFGRGYGEENDFCYRAELYGYKHVLCDDTFVYHKGTGSFLTAEKERLIQEHIGILEERYQSYMRDTHLYCVKNPHQFIRDNLNIYLNLINGKRNLLYVLHADIEEGTGNNIGGTQLHVKDLIEGLIDQYNIFLLTPSQDKLKVMACIGEHKHYFYFPVEHSSTQTFTNSSYRKACDAILNAFCIDIVHVHHIQGVSLDIFYAAHDLNIPIITTIHDFYFVCPTIFLYDEKEHLCVDGYQGNCKQCLKDKIGVSDTVEYIHKWQKENAKALNMAEKIIVPSKSALSVLEQYYPELKHKATTIPHGLDIGTYSEPILSNIQDTERVKVYLEEVDIQKYGANNVSGWAFVEGENNDSSKVYLEVTDCQNNIHRYLTDKYQRMDVDDCFGGCGKYRYSGFKVNVRKNDIPNGKVSLRIIVQTVQSVYRSPEIIATECYSHKAEENTNIAFIGGLSRIKGSDLACSMIQSSNDINWFIFGNIDPKEPLYSLEKDNLYKMGRYQRAEIKKLLIENKIDLVCILSKCSETFCYTLSEAKIARVPTLAFNLGALGERIQEEEIGWVLDAGTSAEKILSKIHTLIESGELVTMKKHIENTSLRTVADMVKDYSVLYHNTRGRQLWREYNPKDIYTAYKDQN